MSNTRAPRHFDSGDVFAICSKHGYSEYVQKSWPIPKQSQDIIEMQTCSIFMRIVVLTTRSRSPPQSTIVTAFAVAASGGPAGPALAEPLFSGSLVSFPDCMYRHPRVAKHTIVMRIRRAAASDMAHSGPRIFI